jgi:hypothetical protein
MGLTVAVSFAFEKLGGLPSSVTVHFMSNTLPAVLGLTTEANIVWDAVGKVLLAAVLLLFFWREPGTQEPRAASSHIQPPTSAPAL